MLHEGISNWADHAHRARTELIVQRLFQIGHLRVAVGGRFVGHPVICHDGNHGTKVEHPSHALVDFAVEESANSSPGPALCWTKSDSDRYSTSTRCISSSLTPASSTNSERSGLYMSGVGRPTSCSTSSMPFSFNVASCARSDEKQIPLRPLPSILRSLSLAVIAATCTPASASAARIVPDETSEASVIITSRPVAWSK